MTCQSVNTWQPIKCWSSQVRLHERKIWNVRLALQPSILCHKPPFYRQSSDTGGCHFMNTILSPRGSCSLITRKIPQEYFTFTLSPMAYRILHLLKRWLNRETSEVLGCRSCVFVAVLLDKWRRVIFYYTGVMHKSLREFRPLRYSSRDGHAEGEHVKRGRDTPSFCPTLQVLDMLTSEGSWQTFLAQARQSRPMAPAGLSVSQRTGSHPAGISCTTQELFCP